MDSVDHFSPEILQRIPFFSLSRVIIFHDTKSESCNRYACNLLFSSKEEKKEREEEDVWSLKWGRET